MRAFACAHTYISMLLCTFVCFPEYSIQVHCVRASTSILIYVYTLRSAYSHTTFSSALKCTSKKKIPNISHPILHLRGAESVDYVVFILNSFPSPYSHKKLENLIEAPVNPRFLSFFLRISHFVFLIYIGN